VLSVARGRRVSCVCDLRARALLYLWQSCARMQACARLRAWLRACRNGLARLARSTFSSADLGIKMDVARKKARK
jgi:hypothetical protein